MFKNVVKFLLCIVLFTSCLGGEPAIFTEDVKDVDVAVGKSSIFVVDEIKSVDDNNCKYYSKKYNYIFSKFLSGRASFIAKKGQFQIGDSVTVYKFTKIKP